MPCHPLLAGATSGVDGSDSFSLRVLLMSSKVALVRLTLRLGYFAVNAAFTAVTHWDCIDVLSVQVSITVMVAAGMDPGSVFTFDGAEDWPAGGAVPPGAHPVIGMATAPAANPKNIRRLDFMLAPSLRWMGGIRFLALLAMLRI